MARSFREKIKIQRPVAPKESKRAGRNIIARAQSRAETIQRQAEEMREATMQVQQKLEQVVEQLPFGLTPALNEEILPPQIRAKIDRAKDDILADVALYDDLIPTPAMREMVYTLAKYGVPLNDIRLRILNPTTSRPISHETLKRHFKEEIDIGIADGNAHLAKVAFQSAVGRAAEYDPDGRVIRGELAPNAAVLNLLLKTRLEYGGGTKNISVVHSVGVDHETAKALQELSDDELRSIRAIAANRADQKASRTSEAD